MNYDDLTKAQQKQVQAESDYTAEQLKSENPYFIEDYELDDYLFQDFIDIFSIDSNVEMYLDDKRIINDLKMDYSEIEIDDKKYWFRAW